MNVGMIIQKMRLERSIMRDAKIASIKAFCFVMRYYFAIIWELLVNVERQDQKIVIII